MHINQLIASRIRDLRSKRGWSLDTLADRSGVSRSNISLIERGESSPTAIVLDKLAAALHVPLASLFERHSSAESPSPVSRADEQVVWTDPASGYLRRHLSSARPCPTQLVEIHFPAGQRVSYETAMQEPDVIQQVWMIRGTMEVLVGEMAWQLAKGDCLTMKLDQRFWMNVADGILQGDRILLVAESHDGRIAGTVQIVIGQPENQPHRADVSKLLVHRDFRCQGVASKLMAEVDVIAAGSARSLLVLDTETGSDAERLYLRSGWTRAGVIPDYALKPYGGLAATTYFYKRLSNPEAS